MELERIKNYEDQAANLKNAAAQSWKSEEERNRLIEAAVKLEVKILKLKNQYNEDDNGHIPK